MKKRIYLSLLICFCTLLSAPAFAQVVTEVIRQSPMSKVHAQSDFEKEKKNYEERTVASGVKNYILKQALASKAKAAAEDEVTLTIVFEYDPEIYSPSAIIVMDGDKYDNTQYKEGEDTMEISVPKGTYDIISNSWNVSESGTLSYVVLEQVEIAGDMTITIRPADAVNLIKGKVYNPAGEEMKPGVISDDWMEIIGGNIEQMLGNYSLIHTETGYEPASMTSQMGFLFSEDDSPMPLYINNVSDRFTIAQARICIDKEGNFFFNKYTCSGINGSITLKNDPADYIVHAEDFQISPIGKDTEHHYPAFSTKCAWNGLAVGSGWSGHNSAKEHNTGKGVTLHLDNRITDKANPNGFDLLVSSGILDYIRTVVYDWGDGEIETEELPVYTWSTSLAIGPDNEIIYGYAGADFYNFSFLIADNGDILEMPFHERFTFDSKQHTDIVLGSTAPVVSVIMQNYYADWFEGDVSFIELHHIGRYGDSKLSDYASMHAVVKHDDEELFSGDYYDLNMFGLFTGISDKGVFEVTFDNPNVEVDGLAGKNYTQLIYDASKEDWTPPTAQMLQFRDNNGQVTDRFATPADGNVRLAAGDFDFISGEHFFFRYREGNTVDFYYSPYNTENWEEIALTEYPEYFYMPGFGSYYEASLAGVNHAAGTTAWYDVKIVCTDAAGNSQMQIISPAFKIGGEVGIKTVESNNVSAYAYPNPFADEVTIAFGTSITGKATLEVYDVLGRLIHQQPMECNGTSSFKWNGSTLKEGVYFYKIQYNGSTLSGKMVKKQ